MALCDVREPARGLEDIVLSSRNLALVKNIIHEHERDEVLCTHGLRPCDRLLLQGPSGCGKTLAAEVIAHELDLPLAIVRADRVVSSFFGETAANLRKVFDFAAASPMVVLFEELSTFGDIGEKREEELETSGNVNQKREDASEPSGLRGAVDAALQMMDAYDGRSLLIAATKHLGPLDSAVWRRFQEVLHFKPPNPSQVSQLMKVLLRDVRHDLDLRADDKYSVGREVFRDRTHAEVEKVVNRALKAILLSGRELCLTEEDLRIANQKIWRE